MKLRDGLKVVLIYSACFYLFSSVMFIFSGSNEKWFPRMALSLMCAGFVYIGECLKKEKEDVHSDDLPVAEQ